MQKKLLRDLTTASYTNGELDEEKASKIASFLNRRMLKYYIKSLKEQERKTHVLIETPYDVMGGSKDILRKIFVDKKIDYKRNDSLLLGTRITNNDMVYEESIDNSLNTIIEDLKENYD